MEPVRMADDFLRRVNMHPESVDTDALRRAFGEDMLLGLAGEPSSLGMFPAYIRGSEAPRPGRVLVIDAGGTNLRLGRARMEEDGVLVMEEVRRRPMPGTSGTVTAEEMFDAIARELFPLLSDCDRGCFCFSYPCEVQPDGDGIAVRLSKELHVEGMAGRRLCAGLEAALRRLGAQGERKWCVINDTVGTMLCGMAESAGKDYDDYIGFILGTGTNACCSIRSELITRSPAAVSMGGDVIVNLECGGFARLERGRGDELLDEHSEAPGEQLAEKMISGAYYPALLQYTLLLAREEGLLGGEADALLHNVTLTMADAGELCGGVPSVLSSLPGSDLAFIRAVNELLLERAARIVAAELAAVIAHRQPESGSRFCICADGTVFERNPLLRPRTEFWLSAFLEGSDVTADFLQVSDATLLGTAYAALVF